ncbi:MAG TPA: 3' terminal RNA ribose 2'-O-methyltransferase Hen1 [Dermatophilaceae bacterium]|nr:3' terminal RNA ribose 2'-O-methyltransferase Hen1 [Dermatophilaceae bacterium]
MFLAVTSTAPQATDLGFLLHKHPDRVQRFDVSVGAAYVFYPEASDERCTAALLLEVDPVGLVRGRRLTGSAAGLADYVNDRPYAASSMLAVALGQVFRTALRGTCALRPDLEGRVLPLEVHVPSVPCRGGADLVRRLFEPLGWQVAADVLPLDPTVPEWGDSRYVDVRLVGEHTLADALTHLYVLLPVLDGAKHYWVSSDEVDKLVRRARSWLQCHPERDLILRRYLAHKRAFVADATDRLAALDDSFPEVDAELSLDPGASDVDAASGEVVEAVETPLPLVVHRRAAVLQALRDVGAARVVDLGCGAGALLGPLLADPAYTEIVGVDVSPTELERAARRLKVNRMSERRSARLRLLQGSATYRDDRLVGYDAIVLMEVIEHLDLDRLPDLERCVFGHARPGAVVVTTPNAEFNVRYETLPAGAMRHPDHRFEWTRGKLESWARAVAAAYGYAVSFRTVGDIDADLGSSTQLALFTRASRGESADD